MTVFFENENKIRFAFTDGGDVKYEEAKENFLLLSLPPYGYGIYLINR